MTIPKRETKQGVFNQLTEHDISFDCSIDYDFNYSKNHFRGHYLAIKKGLSLMKSEQYLLLLEDDVLLASDFKQKIEQIISSSNHLIYSLMTVSEQLSECHVGYLTTKTISWDQGLLIKKETAEEYLNYVENNLDKAKCKWGCDALSIFALQTNKLFYIPVPTVVQHIDGVSSLKNSMFGKSRTSCNFAGKEKLFYPNVYTKKKSSQSKSKVTYQLKNDLH